MKIKVSDGIQRVSSFDRVDLCSAEMEVRDEQSGTSLCVEDDLYLEYVSGRNLLEAHKPDRVFTDGLGSRDFGCGFGLEDTSDWSCLSDGRDSWTHKEC